MHFVNLIIAAFILVLGGCGYDEAGVDNTPEALEKTLSVEHIGRASIDMEKINSMPGRLVNPPEKSVKFNCKSIEESFPSVYARESDKGVSLRIGKRRHRQEEALSEEIIKIKVIYPSKVDRYYGFYSVISTQMNRFIHDPERLVPNHDLQDGFIGFFIYTYTAGEELREDKESEEVGFNFFIPRGESFLRSGSPWGAEVYSISVEMHIPCIKGMDILIESEGSATGCTS